MSLSLPERHFHSGVQLHLSKRYTEAINEYEEALKVKPDYAAVLLNRGGALLELARKTSKPGRSGQKAQRQLRIAEESIRRATRLDPNNPDGYLNLGVLLRDSVRPRLAEAIAAYTSAVQVAPASTAGYEKLGASLLAAADTEPEGSEQRHHTLSSAAIAFGRAVDLAPTDGVLWERRGDALIALAADAQSKRGGYTVARALEDAAVPTPPARVTATTAYSEAVRCFSKAVSLVPSESAAYAKLAIAVHGVGLHTDERLLEPLLTSMRLLMASSGTPSRAVTLPLPADPSSSPSEASAREPVGRVEGASCAKEEQPVPPSATTPAPHQAICPSKSHLASHRALALAACDVVYPGRDLPGSVRGNASALDECVVHATLVRPEPLRAGEEEEEDALHTRADDAPSGQLLAAFATPIFLHRLPRRVASSLHTRLLPELLHRERARPAGVRHSNRGGWQSASDLLSGDAKTLTPGIRQLRSFALDAAAAYLDQLHASNPPARPTLNKPSPPSTSARREKLRVGILNSWANINRAGASNLFHDHPQAMVSGVYFVAGGTGADDADAAEGSAAGTAKDASVGGASITGRVRAQGACHAGNGSLEFIDPRFSLRTHRPPEQFEPSCQRLSVASRALRAGYLFEFQRALQVPPLPGTFVLFPAWLMHRVRPHFHLNGVRASVSFNVWITEDDAGEAGATSSLSAVRRLFDGPAYRTTTDWSY